MRFVEEVGELSEALFHDDSEIGFTRWDYQRMVLIIGNMKAALFTVGTDQDNVTVVRGRKEGVKLHIALGCVSDPKLKHDFCGRANSLSKGCHRKLNAVFFHTPFEQG